MKNVIEVFKYFFRLGIIAFGGPAAHVAMMQQDLVEDKKWMSSQEFLNYMGATNLIPGPNSTEMTMHCGYHKSGLIGLIVAGFSFIIPATCITLIIAIFYDKISDIDWVIPILSGIKASVIAIIIAAIIKLGKKAAKSSYLIAVGIVVLILSITGFNEIACILLAGLISLVIHYTRKTNALNSVFVPLFVLSIIPVSNLKLFWVFFKIGMLLFGSGYVLFAYLEGELINNLGWLTHSDLVEAIAIGQLTPGPILSTSTFIGYKLAGIQGAILATVGIFTPSFFYVFFLNKFLKRFEKSTSLKVFLDSVNIAAVAVMISVTLNITQSIIFDWRTALVCISSCLIYYLKNNLNAIWLLAFGGCAGYLLNFL